MGNFIEMMKNNLSTQEYYGFLKASAIKSILGINSWRYNGCTFMAMRYLDELMTLGLEESSETKEPADSDKIDDKNTVSKSENEPAESKKANTRAEIDPNEVKRLYIEENLTAVQCYEILGVSASAFKRVLRDNKISKLTKRNKPVDSVKVPKTVVVNEAEIEAAAIAAAKDIMGV